jgi:hypothetical protein
MSNEKDTAQGILAVIAGCTITRRLEELDPGTGWHLVVRENTFQREAGIFFWIDSLGKNIRPE